MGDQRRDLDAAGLAVRLQEVVGGAARVAVVPRSASTSTALADALRAAPDDWPDRSVLVADHQDAGRGRRGRTWSTPPRTAVTLSVVLRPDVRTDRWGWLGLLAGVAVADAVADLLAVPTGLKWPNDVLVLRAPGEAAGPGADDVPGWGAARKVAGVLGEVVPTASGPVAVVGIGVNVGQRPDELPVPWATSLAVAAAPADGVPSRDDVAVPVREDVAVAVREDVAVAVVRRLVDLERAWRAAGGDARRAGVAQRCSDACVTLGEPVRVELPGGEVLEGTARSLAADGGLEVVDAAGAVRTVLAGDVHHVRASR